MSKFINPFTDVGFKHIFGQDLSSTTATAHPSTDTHLFHFPDRKRKMSQRLSYSFIVLLALFWGFPNIAISKIGQVEVGIYHTMILKNDGTLWACGYNEHGQLGDGTNTDRLTPVMIAQTDWVTCIGETEAGNCNDDNIYNLKGKKVTTLKKGQIYVKNGKKFFVK